MALITIIKQIKAKQLFGFFRFFIRHPLFAVSTFFATVKTYNIAEKEFTKIHGRNNKANAFRHALWNALIAKSCSTYSNNKKNIIRWTKDVTDWHEKLFVNESLSREMDLHNNQIGRELFINHDKLSSKELSNVLLKSLNSAVFVLSLKGISEATNELVYLED